MSEEVETKILLSQNLEAYFYERLSALNKKSLCPVPSEIIYYSSIALKDNFHSKDFFDQSSGKSKDKILGLKLLQSKTKSKEEKKRELKEIGDMSLIVSGYFSNSLNKKIIDENYYKEIGRMAYLELNNYIPAFMEVRSFYKALASSFEVLMNLLSLLSLSQEKDPYEHLLLNDLSDEEMRVMGVSPMTSRKVS